MMTLRGYVRYTKHAKHMLFKYCHPGKVGLEHSVFTSAGIRLRATPPTEFNDPFEFASNILTGDEQKMIDSLPDIFEHGAGTKAILGATMLSYEDFATRWQRLREQISETYGILCFSACWDDILMWSHYADEHRGFAVAIDRDHPHVERLGFQPVSYAEQRPKHLVEIDGEIGGFSIPGEHVMTSTFTKSINWSYEYEWRSLQQLDTTKKVTLVDIPAEAIPMILLGWRCSDHTVKLVSDAVANWPAKPRIARLMPHWTDYRLDDGDWLPEDGVDPSSCLDEDEIKRTALLKAGLDRGRSEYLARMIKIQSEID
jgi:hypothetical protein